MILAQNLTRETAELLAYIDKECFEKDAYTAEEWLETFNPNVRVLFVIEDKKVVGAAVWEKFPGAKTGYLISNAVLPDYRKKGYGTELLVRRMEEAKGLGIHYLFAHTRSSNEDSQRLLLAEGFKPVGIEHNFYPDEAAIQWKLKL